MSTWFNSQTRRSENKYSLQFETDNYEEFKKIENACHKAVVKAEKERMKARAKKMSTLGHL